jgi:hypothetical protein
MLTRENQLKPVMSNFDGIVQVFVEIIVAQESQIELTTIQGRQDETSGYSTRHVLKYSIPLTLVALLVLIPIEVTWWIILGLV